MRQSRTRRPTPLAVAAEHVGDRWSLLLVDALMSGPLRFGELGDAVEGIAPNILSRRLRDLEATGVIVSRPYSERPVRVVYELSSAGRGLAGALALLDSWGARHGAWAAPHGTHDDRTGRHHDACGSELEARLWCPTCDRPVDEPESDELIWV